ncbi:RNA methyltransferase [bacterium]|nr:RNA methyltransferase [bacterium]
MRALGERRGRRREGKFLVEGPKVIRELIARKAGVELLLWKEGAEQKPELARLIAEARALGIEAFAVSPALFSELVATETSQGAIAVAPQRWSSLEEALGPETTDEKAPPRAIVVAAGLQDPGNLGTILRSARFLGVAGVACLAGTTDPWSPKVVRASAGTLIESPPARLESIAELAVLARARGYRTVALVARGGRPLEAAPLPRRSILLLGAEGPGLSTAISDAADERVTILPSDPRAESLNAAMAFAVFAHAWRMEWARPDTVPACPGPGEQPSR